MKNIKQLRESYDLITEKEELEQRKLTMLVRAGLFDVHKLPLLKRALDKNTEKMNPNEKKVLIDLLDSLMNQVLGSDQVFMKVKRNVQMDEESASKSYSKKLTISGIPTIVVLKRKSVRSFPGGRLVGLYYAQQIDKYVTIPFDGDANDEKSMPIFEEALDEISDQTAHNAFAKLHYKTRETDDPDEKEKYFKKTAKVGLMQVAKVARRDGWEKGGPEAKKMLKYSKKYREVADLTEATYRSEIVPRPKEPSPAAPNNNPTDSNSAAPASGGAPKKSGPRKPKGRKQNNIDVKQLLKDRASKLSNKKYNSLSKTQKKFLTPGRAAATAYDNSNGHGVRNAVIAGTSTALLRAFDKSKKSLEESTTEVVLNGNAFLLNTDIADKLIHVYDTLNEDNKNKMIDMLQNKETQNKIVEFVRRY